MPPTLQARIQKKPLTDAQKSQIWQKIGQGLEDPEERDPMDVIAKDFNGSEEDYLRRMAQHHGIPLS